MTPWCERHWSVVRDDPSINGVLASILLIQYLLNDDSFTRLCGYDPDAGTKADIGRANEEMERIGPICCYLGDDRMQQLYAEARMA